MIRIQISFEIIESLFRKILETSLSANIVQGTPNLGRGGGGVQRFFRNKPKISRFFRNKDIFCTKALGLHRGMHTSTERIANALKYPEYRKFSPAALECTYQSHRCTNHWEVISAVIGWFEVRWSIVVIYLAWLPSHFGRHTVRQTLWMSRPSTKPIIVGFCIDTITPMSTSGHNKLSIILYRSLELCIKSWVPLFCSEIVHYGLE